MERFMQALELLPLGMITVFAILIFVMILGRLIIAITNRYPEEKANTKENTPPPARVNPNKIAIIVAAVSAVTGGKGKITRIERID